MVVNAFSYWVEVDAPVYSSVGHRLAREVQDNAIGCLFQAVEAGDGAGHSGFDC